MPESEPVVTEAKTLLEQEQDLDKLRHDYFSAKGVKRAVFKRQESLSDDAIRRLGKSYETLKNEVVSRKLKIKIDKKNNADFNFFLKYTTIPKPNKIAKYEALE